MRPQELIEKKRDGGTLTVEDIDAFIEGVCDKSWADYQISAMLMAIFVNGFSVEEQNALTYAMLHSGEILNFSDIGMPKADKHSTGGVGDKTSLIVAPLVAACGVAVPMISGRGLGHTGGTLDKLESIEGFNVNLSTDEFRRVLKECGFAMAGQTKDIAPADRKLYALRDATATVPSIPLIVGSIMSKKLAEGLGALVLDVKTGAGAFMSDPKSSELLAHALVDTGQEFGLRTEAIISDMSQPLGQYVGNSQEVYECIRIMSGETTSQSAPTLELSLALCARMLVMTGIAKETEEALRYSRKAVTSGKALEKFEQNIKLQGGNAEVCKRPELLINPHLCRIEISASADGFVETVDAHEIGNAVVAIGGGRRRAEDAVDHAVGYECLSKIGDKVARGQPLGVLYCRDASHGDGVLETLNRAYVISETEPYRPDLVQAVIAR